MISETGWLLRNSRIAHTMRRNRKKKNDSVYLFLDFDGVINVFCLEGTPEYEEAISRKEFDFVRKSCMDKLNAFFRDYPCKLIISSSWRYAGEDYCMKYLYDHGMDRSITLQGMTEVRLEEKREEEIIDYLLEKDDYSGYIIFDDGPMPHIRDYLIQTDPLKGWDDEADEKARALMRRFQ